MGYEIGTTSTTEPLADVGITEPERSTFEPWGSTVRLGDMNMRALGFAIATWHWRSTLSTDERETLQTYISGPSAEIYIKTPDRNLDFKTYRVIAEWPDLKGLATLAPTFALRFTILEEITS